MKGWYSAIDKVLIIPDAPCLRRRNGDVLADIQQLTKKSSGAKITRPVIICVPRIVHGTIIHTYRCMVNAASQYGKLAMHQIPVWHEHVEDTMNISHPIPLFW
jgi:hypothetical protein